MCQNKYLLYWSLPTLDAVGYYNEALDNSSLYVIHWQYE